MFVLVLKKIEFLFKIHIFLPDRFGELVGFKFELFI